MNNSTQQWNEKEYLEGLSQNPDRVLSIIIHDLRAFINPQRLGAQVLTEMLQSPEANQLDEIDIIRDLARSVLQNAEVLNSIVEATAEFHRTQAKPLE